MKAYFYNEENYKNEIPQQFNIEDIKRCKIYDTEPKELESFPMIILNNGSGGVVNGGLGDISSELYDYNGDLIGYRYGGMYDFSITLEVATRSVYEREFLADLVAMVLRVQLKRQLEADGILIKDIKFTGESSIMLNSDKIYISNITLSIWSQWYENIEFIPIDNVNLNFDLSNKGGNV